MIVKGFRTLREARDASGPTLQEKPLHQNDRLIRWGQKEEIYAKYEKLHPGVMREKDEPSHYRIFWRDWIERCPAFRSDRIIGKGTGGEQCGSMAIITAKKGRMKWILCPECGYEGEHFRIESIYS